jgi:Zn-dependent M28 family amino/carboxypeptidase
MQHSMDKNKVHSFFRVSVALLLLVFVDSTIPATVQESTADRLHTHVAWLADAARQGRRAGSAGAAESATYISTQFRQLGFEVEVQEFGANRRNVIARYGSANKTILAGAHYDGQGPGFPSAGDNAAGVAVLLELARNMKAAKLPATLVLCAFDEKSRD